MKLDLKTLGYIKFFENYTHTIVKDCFVKNGLVFIVNPGEIGKAIGKKGANIRFLNTKFGKSIRVIEYSPDVVQFVKNLIYPIKVEVENRGEKIVIVTEDTKTKGFLFGRDKSKLKDMEEIVKRYFDVSLEIE